MAAAVWATVAGLAPVLAAAVTLLVPVGRGTLAELGFTTPGAAAVAGVLAAAVLARQAHLRQDLARAFLAVAVAGRRAPRRPWSRPTSRRRPPRWPWPPPSWWSRWPPSSCRRDPFWHRPLGVVAELAEIGGRGGRRRHRRLPARRSPIDARPRRPADRHRPRPGRRRLADGRHPPLPGHPPPPRAGPRPGRLLAAGDHPPRRLRRGRRRPRHRVGPGHRRRPRRHRGRRPRRPPAPEPPWWPPPSSRGRSSRR